MLITTTHCPPSVNKSFGVVRGGLCRGRVIFRRGGENDIEKTARIYIVNLFFFKFQKYRINYLISYKYK